MLLPTTEIPTDELALAQDYYPDRFCQRVSAGSFVPYRYQRMMMRSVGDAIWNGGGRIIINAPSRHCKSTAISHKLPVWFLNTFPSASVILSSYGQDLASAWARKVRNEFQSNPMLTTKLSDDSQAVNRWHTTAGGEMGAMGVGGPSLGFGGKLVIVDDPHKDWEEAHSATIRDRTIEWFNSTLMSRQEPGAVFVVIQQRFDEDDLSGWLIEHHPDSWKVLSFPALAMPGDILGRQPGEALCPARYTADALHAIKREMDAAAWEAMFQQNPAALSSGRLYDHFNQAHNIDKAIALRNELPLQLSFDFNFNPGMHILVGQNDKRADVLYDRHEIHGAYLKLQPALEMLGKMIRENYGGFGRWPLLEIFGDSSGTQERAETTSTCYQIILAWAKGLGVPFKFRVPAANPPVRTRIDTVNHCLRDPEGEIHYRCHSDCVRLIADFKQMKPDEMGLEDKRDSRISHASSALGYRLCWDRPLRRITPASPLPVFGN